MKHPSKQEKHENTSQPSRPTSTNVLSRKRKLYDAGRTDDSCRIPAKGTPERAAALERRKVRKAATVPVRAATVKTVARIGRAMDQRGDAARQRTIARLVKKHGSYAGR